MIFSNYSPQPNPRKSEKVNPIRPNPTQLNPPVIPTHGHLWFGLTAIENIASRNPLCQSPVHHTFEAWVSYLACLLYRESDSPSEIRQRHRSIRGLALHFINILLVPYSPVDSFLVETEQSYYNLVLTWGRFHIVRCFN